MEETTDDGASRSVIAIKTDHGGTPLKKKYTKNQSYWKWQFGAFEQGRGEGSGALAAYLWHSGMASLIMWSSRQAGSISSLVEAY